MSQTTSFYVIYSPSNGRKMKTSRKDPVFAALLYFRGHRFNLEDACDASSAAATAAKMAASNEFDLVAVCDVAAAAQDLAAGGAAAVAVDYRVCALNAAVFTTPALADDDDYNYKYKVGAPNEAIFTEVGLARGAGRSRRGAGRGARRPQVQPQPRVQSGQARRGRLHPLRKPEPKT